MPRIFMLMNPKNAKLRFRLRTLTNLLLVICIFIALLLVLGQFFTYGLVTVVAIAAMFYLYFFILDKRAIKMQCGQCQKLISSNVPWLCGFCQKNNRKVDEFPFLYQCEHCGAEPKAYKCHHCGGLIFLTEDELKVNYASCPGTDVKPEPPPDENALLAREQRAMEHKLTMTKMSAELEDMQRKAESAKPKSPTDKVEESFSRHHVTYMAAHDIARREKAANAEKYKDDPYLLERADESVDDWLQKHL